MCCSNQAARHALQGAACACLEQLEVRRLMSFSSYSSPKSPAPPPKDNGCAIETYDADKDRNRCQESLRIRGTEGCDTVAIYDDAACDRVIVWADKDRDKCLDDCEITELKGIEKIEVDLKGGDDHLSYILVSDFCRDKRNVKIDLGCGDDCFELETGCAPERKRDNIPLASTVEQEREKQVAIKDCSDVCFEVKGNDGCDKIDIDLGNVSICNSKVTLKVDAGKGNDCVEYELPAVGEENGSEEPTPMSAASENGPTRGAIIDRSTLKASFELGDGCDVMKIATRTIMIDSTVETCVNGGRDSDKVYDEEAYGLLGCTKYNVKVDLGKGNDEYCQSFNAGSFVDCKASACFDVKGDYGCDEIKVRTERILIGTASASSEPNGPEVRGIQGSLAIILDGGCDNDKVDIDLACAALHVGEKGKLKLSASGGDGKDCVAVSARVDECSDGCYEICVSGGKGDDKVALGFQDDSCGGGQDPQVAAAGYTINLGGGSRKDPPKSEPKSRHNLVLDGGQGCDEWDTEGNKGEEVCPRNVERLCEGLLPPFCDVLIPA